MSETLPKPDRSVAANPLWARKLAIEMMAMAVILAVAMAADTPPAAVTERDLEAAIHREVVLGDLRGAMEQYRAILARPAKTRPVAARALFQIGECLEKSGQAEDAYNIYRKVAAEYGDQTGILTSARLKMAAWSAPRNLRFEEGAPGKFPPGWLTPSLGKEGDNLPELQREGCRSRVGCAVVMVPANMPKAVGNLMQSFSAAGYRGKTVRLRAWLKLEAFYVTPTSMRFPSHNSDDSAQLWLKVVRPDRRPGFSMENQPVLAGEWTQREIVAMIDDDAQFIRFGVMCIGGGQAWVDDVSFEVISQ